MISRARALSLLLAVPGVVGGLSWAAPQVRAESVNLDRIVAVVGNQIILMSELEDELLVSPIVLDKLQTLGNNATPAKVEAVQEQLRPQVLDAMVADALVMAETERYPSTKLTEEELDGYLQNIAASNQIGSVAELQKLVEETEEYGSWAHYKGTIRKQASVYKVEQMLVPYSPVTDAQVLAHYRSLKAEEAAVATVQSFIFPKQQVAAAKALVAASAGEEPDYEALRTTAEAAGARVEDQEIKQGTAVSAVDNALFAAEEGQFVGPFEQRGSLVVYRVQSVSGSELVDYESAKDRLRMQLEEQSRRKAVASFREELRIRAHIDIRL